jgi:replicative DNA helicase
MNAPDNLLVPPHSIDAEQSVLGAILLEGDRALDRIEGAIAEGDFYRNEHRLIFAAVRKLSNAGGTIDTITVAEDLNVSGSLERIGGLPYLGELAQNTPSAANIKRYAEIVKARSLQRQLMTLASEITANCMAPSANVAEIISQADAAMVQLLDTGTDEPVLLYDAMTEAIADIDDRATGNRRSGLQTGVADFDALTGGLEPGQLVIVAARPSIGKTALGLNIADHITQQRHPVAFFSLEMTRRELTQRLIALRTGVSVAAQRSGQLDDEQWSRVSACQGKADGQRLFMIDRTSIGVAYVRAAARNIKRKHGLGVIVVDYLGLMRGEGQNRTQEIGSLSRGLKALAKELQVPVIALAQLNRGVEGRTDKRPMLSDLRDSGEIEQDADIVVMLHREDKYPGTDPKWHGVAELLVLKNRSGATGELCLTFDGPSMQFSAFHGPNPRYQVARRSTATKPRYTGGIDD